MSNGYPTNHEQAGDFHSPEEFEDVQHKSMTNVEIGIIVGTVLAFSVVLALILYCRHAEQKRKARRTAAHLEEGRNRGTDASQHESNGTNESNTPPAKRMPILNAFWLGRGG